MPTYPPCLLWYDSDPEDGKAQQERGGAVVTFEEVVDQAIAMLQRRGRVTYRMLKRQFQLDDAALEDLRSN